MKSITIGVTLFVGLNLGLFASEVLIGKSGPFANFDRCEVTKTKTTLSIGSSHHNQLIEVTNLETNADEILKYSNAALKAAGNRYYRWFNTQTDYNVRNTSGQIVPYYSIGFSNINNDSDAALYLRQKTDQICDKVNDFKLLGSFTLDLKIGDRIFKDKLLVQRSNGSVVAEYIVPNSFASKIKNLDYKNGSYTFTIHVKEGEQEYDAAFEGTIDEQGKLKGNAFFLPDRSLLGSFIGKKD
ncbi:MAG: hypothetical protein CME70_14885 [Halobacteriovorax sp.]|nr:hypothetical protein [Halobacteriovorax sp.]|tara:strand:- start:153179 stop:153901 length:723 start_codon:yes stop_codon:yes gene_type:complete